MDFPPLCLMITTKKLFPLLAMNPKERWSLVSSDNNQEVILTSCNEPKDVGLLCPVINQEANLASWNEPKECWSLVFSVCNQEDLILKVVTKSKSLEKLFVRVEERKNIE